MSLRVRLADADDIPAVRDLLVRSWHDTYDAIYGAEKVEEITGRWHSEANLARQLDQPLSLFVVADAGGRIAGTAKAIVTSGGAVLLERLYVDPAQQRSGIGGALLNAMLEAYPGASRMQLEVEPKNLKAVAFYRKHDFRPAGATGNCGGDSGVGADRMERVLRPAAQANAPVMIRPVRDTDAQDLIGLITLCFAEYPGCYFDPHGDMPDIVHPAQSRMAVEGLFLVVEDASGRVSACAGVDFPDNGTAELHRLYVRPDVRGGGLAKLLTRRLEGCARRRGATRMVLWSDTRFTRAHALYDRLGYRQGPSRSLGDISHSRELFFERAL